MKLRSTIDPGKGNSRLSTTYKIAGLVLILAGLLLGLDQFLRTGWLTFVIFPVCGLFIISFGYYLKSFGWIITGCVLTGLGFAGFFILGQVWQQSAFTRIGFAAVAFGLSWLLVALLSYLIHQKVAWWALIPAGVIIGVGAAALFTPTKIVGYAFLISCGLGVSLLAWGLGARLFGLIIPGSLLMGIGPGIYFAWRDLIDLNALAQTGVMLVWFAFGWGLITILARRTSGKFIWWPLIPGGILAVAGWGLFIGGDPSNALGFIGNTGSVAMLVFGLYLLLMRKSMHP